MIDYEKQLLKNVFAENNLVNLDFRNHPEKLASIVQESGPRDSRDTHPDTRTIIKRAITQNDQLMKFESIGQNKAISQFLNKQNSSPSESIYENRQSNDPILISRNQSIPEMSRNAGAREAEGLNSGSKPELESSLETKSNFKKIKADQGTRLQGKLASISGVTDLRDDASKPRLTSGIEKQSNTTSGQFRNIFSASTNMNSQGTQLKARFADQG